MSFSTSDVIIIFIYLFFLYTTPLFYTLITIYGAFKKHEHTVLVKTILYSNLLITANIIYYLFPTNSLPNDLTWFYFYSISLMFFLPPSVSLLISFPRKYGFYTYIVLFSLSFCLYNNYYLPEKLKQDQRAMIISLLKKGDIEKVNQAFNNTCPNESIVFDYLSLMTTVETYPEKSFAFLLDCTDKHTTSRYFVGYYQEALDEEKVNASLLNLLFYKYYQDLNNHDKNDIVSNFIFKINNSDSNRGKLFADRFNTLINMHPELKKYIKIDDKHILHAVDNGEIVFINYIKPYYSTHNEDLFLAIRVLEHNDEKIISDIGQDKDILNTKILSSIGGIWGDREVDLLSYIFRYGSENLISWLLAQSLDSTAKFDYKYEYPNVADQQGKYSCENYLLKYIDFNPELSDEQKRSISKELKKRSNCPSR